MNTLLWVLQAVLALLCISGGAFQIFKFEELQTTVAAMRELPRGLWAFLGALGCLEGVALILPGVLNVLPVATPIAAVAVAVQSLLISGFYVHYRDHPPLPYVVVMAILGAFIAYGRFALSPF